MRTMRDRPGESPHHGGVKVASCRVWITWREAIRRALYGERGFYLHQRPSGHFRTSVAASPVFAEAIGRLLGDVDARLGRPETLDFVDMGAGDGTLAARVLALAPPELAGRLRVTAVELAPRPPGLPARIAWRRTVPDRVCGLVVANEWLDNVPLDVAELTEHGPRIVLVDPCTGAERLGGEPCAEDLAWLERWWPLRKPGDRAEIGRPRDEAWAALVGRLERGLVVAADYAHSVHDRPPAGTLTAYREGRTVPPVPDGSCDITAHVALDAVAAAGERAGATGTVLTTQREALRALGVTGARPPLDLARTDPRGYLQALARAAEEAELIDPAGLGAFGWLAQRVNLA
ncbi:SAM-dependent MidA family methyltransferase [Thermopolyspora flexuosa]|uniref:SAM-dependent MidA family methyltransferase n=1 Tax=Thermopolyspora flexuosa TaxID=103836 RepID=A0A543J3V3_9ACTN|nr:SAM-dependent MidA family methyltransferase [Thermopolyspora flexuosa]